jgi:nitrous oxidase accessory protein
MRNWGRDVVWSETWMGPVVLIVVLGLLMGAGFSASAATIEVRAGQSIQEAVDKADPGDVVDVMPGVYRGEVRILQPIILKGAGRGSVVDAERKDYAIALLVDGVSISGLVATNSSQAGILVAANRCSVKSCRSMGNRAGIKLTGSSNRIEENRVSKNQDGVVLLNASNNTLSKNAVSENNLAWGGDCGIILIRSSWNTLLGNNVTDNSDCAISLRGSRYNLLVQNNASCSDWYGIYLNERSDDNLVEANLIEDNRQAGLCLEDSRNNTLSGNLVQENGRGIYLTYDSYGNQIRDNSILDNRQGVQLAFHSRENALVGNLIQNNQYGVYLAFSASRNLIVQNRLIDNIYNAYDEGMDNRWDDGAVGNFYSDLSQVYHIPGGVGADLHPMPVS